MRDAALSLTIWRVAEPIPIVYREEVLTIMGVIGDIRDELRRIREALGGDDEEEEEA